MSRIGKAPINILDGVKVSVDGCCVNVEGPKGKLSFSHPEEVSVSVSEDGKTALVARASDERTARAFHGLTRSLINNMVIGVKDGYEKK